MIHTPPRSWHWFLTKLKRTNMSVLVKKKVVRDIYHLPLCADLHDLILEYVSSTRQVYVLTQEIGEYSDKKFHVCGVYPTIWSALTHACHTKNVFFFKHEPCTLKNLKQWLQKHHIRYFSGANKILFYDADDVACCVHEFNNQHIELTLFNRYDCYNYTITSHGIGF